MIFVLSSLHTDTDCDPSCNRGLMRCFGPGPGDCCNFYQEGLCVADCGSGLVPNSQYNCGEWVQFLFVSYHHSDFINCFVNVCL